VNAQRSLLLLSALWLAPTVGFAQSGTAAILEMMKDINGRLERRGFNVALEEIEFFTIGWGRPRNHLHQTPYRWVAGDERRQADGGRITYMVDQSWGPPTASGVSMEDSEGAIDRSLETWGADACLATVDIVKRPYAGDDVTTFDYFFGFGGYGSPFEADVVHAGWFPRIFFDLVGGPGGGTSILALSVTFVFTRDGQPTDIDDDGYLDTAITEIYYNDTFGDRGDERAELPWGVDVRLPGIDVETVALHQNGHALGLGHFGPPPAAVMNPTYAGLRQEPLAIDRTGMCAVWEGWAR